MARETILCNGKGNCKRACGGFGECLEGKFILLNILNYIPQRIFVQFDLYSIPVSIFKAGTSLNQSIVIVCRINKMFVSVVRLSPMTEVR